jgi:hypothetical protein
MTGVLWFLERLARPHFHFHGFFIIFPPAVRRGFDDAGS